MASTQVSTISSGGQRMLTHFLGALLFLGAGIAHAAIPATEREVLLNLYAYTDGVNWDNKTGWNGPPGTECSWFGITCNAQGNSVTAIDLAGNELSGSLPSLSGLTNLESFDVHQTATSGIGGYNSLTGQIPSLSALTKLTTFIANNTFFTGDIPSLSGLANLRHFECNNCGLHGSIPPLSGLENLIDFDANSNQLTGPIPLLADLPQLATFDVSVNHLTGELPELAGLKNLVSFDAGGNLLVGDVPDLVGLTKLQLFGAGNLLNGHLGTLEDLPNLELFNVSGNLLTGGIPSPGSLPSLQRFVVSLNQLTGQVPDLSGLTSLIDLSISYNQLSGPLPAPPPALVAESNSNNSATASVCPNQLIPATDPPSLIDLDWNTVTGATPWSKDCAPDPVWKTVLYVYSGLNPSTFEQPVTYTAVVWGMHPTGTVTFTTRLEVPNNTQATTLCDSVALQGSIATCTVNSFVPRTSNVVIATYSGDAQNAPADNVTGYIFGNILISSIDQLVSGTITESTTAATAQIGQPVDIAARWDGGDPNDTITFYDGRVPLCSKVALYAVDGKQVGHCVTHFATLGPHSITAQNDGKGFTDGSQPLIETVVASAPFDADQFALTGSWFNPVTSGQGLELEVYPDLGGAGAALLYGGWFTYDDAGNQQWATFQGNLSSVHGAAYTLRIGENTGGAFDMPPVTQAVQAGTATMAFYDCTHATLTYQFDDGRNGTIPYVRLTSPSGCSNTVPATAPIPSPGNYNDVLHSGVWYEPATAGQGLVVDMVPSMTTFFAAWYTYAPQSDGLTGVEGQRWFTLQDNTYTPGDLDLHDVPIIATSGGIFNTPSAATSTQVGSADVDFQSCSTMRLTYTFTAGEFAGLSGSIDEHKIATEPGCH